ncbi:hypothetical protein LIER_19282 [Lithospermum erythrorhizon]|uniref:Uncharacterized protein n=1 Tax=Lithospermum erythrorhizon TaxID=34254 RepID=A0AAV3QH52_LITER
MSYGSNSVHPTPSPPPIKSSQNDSPSSPSTPTFLHPRGVSNRSRGNGHGRGRGRGRVDGNCGYRAAALHIYGNENEGDKVSKECGMELHQRKDLYQGIMSYEDLDLLFRKIAFFGADNAPLFNSMTFLEFHMSEDNNFFIPMPALYWEAKHNQSGDNLMVSYRARMDNYNTMHARRDYHRN